MEITIKNFVVLVSASDGNIYQVALDDSQMETIGSVVESFFENGIQVLETPIQGVEIVKKKL